MIKKINNTYVYYVLKIPKLFNIGVSYLYCKKINELSNDANINYFFIIPESNYTYVKFHIIVNYKVNKCVNTPINDDFLIKILLKNKRWYCNF